MKKTLLAACVAVSVAAPLAACHRDPPRMERGGTPAPVAVRAGAPSERSKLPGSSTLPARTPAELPTAAEPRNAAVVSVTDRDAGSGDLVPEPTPLALEHEHPGTVNHLQRSRDLRDQGELEGALTEARRALFDSPDDEDALSQIARLGQLTHNLDFAARAMAQIGELHPQDATPMIAEARIELSMGEFDRAIASGNEAIRRDGQNAEGFAITGRAHLAGGDLQGAIDLLQQAVELAPNHGYALNNLGFALLRASRNEEAVEALTRAATLLPNVGYVQNNLGVALERTGKLEQAQAAYDRASLVSPKYLNAHLNAERIRRLASAQKLDPEKVEQVPETAADATTTEPNDGAEQPAADPNPELTPEN